MHRLEAEALEAGNSLPLLSGLQLLRVLPEAWFMRLYVEPMDAVVIEVTDDGRVRLDDGELSVPTLQEKRAILYSARGEMEALAELVDILERQT